MTTDTLNHNDNGVLACLVKEGQLGVGALLTLIMVVLSFYHFLVFHILVELFSVGVGVMMFTIAWNTYPHSRNNFLLFIASGYFWIAMLDVAHTLAYKGMNILTVDSANIATQLWIVPRYFEALVLLGAPLFITREMPRISGFLLLGSVSLLFGLLIATGNFPDAYIEGEGLTRFKVFSEYLIILLLTGALYHLYSKRRQLNKHVVILLSGAIILTMGSELLFTFYISVYGISNLMGHVFKLLSYWLLYMTVVQYTLAEPYRALKTSETNYSTLLDNLPEVLIWQKNANSEFVACNENLARNLGRLRSDIVGKTDYDLFPRELAEKYRADDKRIMAYGQGEHFEESYVHDGKEYFVHTIKAPICEGSGACSGTLGIAMDITERKEAEEALRLAATAFESYEGIVVTDGDGKILRVNNAFSQITGYSETEVMGENPRLLKSGRHERNFYRDMWNTLQRSGYWRGEIWNRRKNGEVYPEWLSITAVKDELGTTTHYIAHFLDITERKRAESLERHAYYDPLTDLPNRRFFEEMLDRTLAMAQRHTHCGALMFLDLDNLKLINDEYGHDIGDALLVEASRRLETMVRKEDLVARIGGDEFVILLPDLASEMDIALTHVQSIAEKIQGSLAHDYVIQGRKLTSSASIGISMFPVENESREQLLKQADTAMYEVKKSGRNAYRIFNG